jgi:hypothetical protein
MEREERVELAKSFLRSWLKKRHDSTTSLQIEIEKFLQKRSIAGDDFTQLERLFKAKVANSEKEIAKMNRPPPMMRQLMRGRVH